MQPHFTYYISAEPGQSRIRDALSRLVTDLPVDLTWRIALTPAGHTPIDVDALRSADLHLLILVDDIRAPVGREWMLAGRRRPLPLHAAYARPTQAAVAFRRHVAQYTPWTPFADLEALRAIARRALSERLLQLAPTLGLIAAERAALRDLDVAEATSSTGATSGRSTPASADSIVIAQARYEPSAGVLLQSPAGADDDREPT